MKNTINKKTILIIVGIVITLIILIGLYVNRTNSERTIRVNISSQNQ